MTNMEHRKQPAKRLFKGVAGSPLATVAAEPTEASPKRRGRPRKYASPEQARAAEAVALKKKRQAEKNDAEIQKVVDTSGQVDTAGVFIQNAGRVFTGHGKKPSERTEPEQIDDTADRAVQRGLSSSFSLASPAPETDVIINDEEQLIDIEAKRTKLLNLPIPTALRWILENSSVDEILEVISKHDQQPNPGAGTTGQNTPSAITTPDEPVRSAKVGTHTLRTPEHARMDECLRKMVDSVIQIVKPCPVEPDTLPDSDGPVEQIERVEVSLLTARCTICGQPLDGLRGAWAGHLLTRHTTDVRRWFRESEAQPVRFSGRYFGINPTSRKVREKAANTL